MSDDAAVAAGTFGAGHIALTAMISALLAMAVSAWRVGRAGWVDALAAGALTGAAVFLWRTSANMPQLNADGLPGFSANDWLAPVLSYVVLLGYADLRPPRDPRRFAQARALSAVAALVVNVITI